VYNRAHSDANYIYFRQLTQHTLNVVEGMGNPKSARGFRCGIHSRRAYRHNFVQVIKSFESRQMGTYREPLAPVRTVADTGPNYGHLKAFGHFRYFLSKV
jgi:hypothetical protein